MAEQSFSRLYQLWTDGTLVGAATSVVSSWLDLMDYDALRIGRTSTGGAYEFRVEWSRDGAVVDMTEVVTVTESTTVEKPVGARYARFRVHNTDAAAAFTAHRTNVFGR